MVVFGCRHIDDREDIKKSNEYNFDKYPNAIDPMVMSATAARSVR